VGDQLPGIAGTGVERTDVVIVGAGPVGLCTAIGLRHFGVDCAVVERHPSTLDFPKGRGVLARPFEIFRQWGLEDRVAAVCLSPGQAASMFQGNTLFGDAFKRTHATGQDTFPNSPTPPRACSQERLEPVLLRAAIDAGAMVHLSTRLVDLSQHADGVTAVVSDEGGGTTRELEAAYLVAADGARSTVRDMVGIETRELTRVGDDTISILFEADLRGRIDDRTSALYWLGRPRPGTVVALVDNETRWILMVPYHYEDEAPESFTDEVCAAMVDDALGVPGFDARVVGIRHWHSAAVLADRFRAGRVFLAGDAAHVTTPAGGLGMTTGIADAHNLAWKLAGVLHRWARASLLDSYDEERRPAARRSVEASVEILQAPPMQPRRLASDGLVLGHGYDSAIIVPDGTDPPTVGDALRDFVPTARPGHRAPHVWVEHDGRQVSILDLFGSEFVLLGGPQSLSAPDGTPLRSVSPSGDWRSLYGVSDTGMVLVRPDGHVAARWRTRPEPLQATVEHALRVATGSPAPSVPLR
jgi:2-polyprenyl-6-methoxyphenol hydroxylase-like FAD-dependent oxidoreductase